MTIEPNMRQLDGDLFKLAQLTNKELVVVIREQARLFCMDAAKSTPPFTGNPYAPITEKWSSQKKAGENAVTKDITEKAMQPLSRIAIVRNDGSGKLGRYVKLLIKRKRTLQAEQILRKAGIKLQGIIPKADEALHQRIRNNRGRVNRMGGYLVTQERSVKTYVNKVKKRVGLAKAGWTYAIKAVSDKLKVRDRLPAWLKKMRSSSSGIYFEAGSGDNVQITVGNSVPHAQGMRAQIEEQALKNRIRNLPLQVAGVERALARKARQWR